MSAVLRRYTGATASLAAFLTAVAALHAGFAERTSSPDARARRVRARLPMC